MSHFAANQQPRLGKASLTGGLLMAAFFLGFGGWALLVPLGSALVTTAVVEVEDQRKLVQHFEGGIVAALPVREGAKVQAGEILIGLDTTQPRARLVLLEGRLANRLALAARLRAERDGLPDVFFPQEPVLATPAGRDAVAVQAQLFQARRQSLAGQRAILNKRIEQTSEEIGGLQQLVQAHDRLLATLQQEAGDLEGLFDQGLTTRERYMALRRRQAELEGERAVHVASVSRARKAISELEQQIGELDITRLNEVVAELSEVEADLVDLQQQVLGAKDVLERATIRAPLAGTVMNLRVHSTRGVINPGEALMEIVPDDPRIVLKAHVRPEDIDEIEVGQAVDVRLRSRDGLARLPVSGSIRSISADRFVDERSAQSFFLVVIDMNAPKTTPDTAMPLLPGMSADISIIAESRTLAEYLAAPLSRRVAMAMRE